MYTRDKLIAVLKIKNTICSFLVTLFLCMVIFDVFFLLFVYWGEWWTILHARSFKDDIVLSIVSAFMFIPTSISKRWIGDAQFYSSCFEGDLDGYVDLTELSAVTRNPQWWIEIQLLIFRFMYMKNYKMKTINGVTKVVLGSKTSTCECRTCGAIIEKSMYFTGSCKYCGSSDLYARVLTEQGFYSITSDISGINNRTYLYSNKKMLFLSIWYFIGIVMSFSWIVISVIAIIDHISMMNNHDYLVQELLYGDGPRSIELIQRDLMGTMILFAASAIILIPVAFYNCKKVQMIQATYDCGRYFWGRSNPTAYMSQLTYVKNRKNKKQATQNILNAIRNGYLRNCTVEKRVKALKMVVARKIVKDACPHCNAPVVGVADAKYVCKYCGNTIMGVIERK